MNAIVFLAAAPNTLEKLKQIPPAFWMKVGLAVLAIIVVVTILRRIFKMNKFILMVVCLVALAFTMLNWVYYRTEPAFLTPFVNKIAPFLPTQGAYYSKPPPPH